MRDGERIALEARAMKLAARSATSTLRGSPLQHEHILMLGTFRVVEATRLPVFAHQRRTGVGASPAPRMTRVISPRLSVAAAAHAPAQQGLGGTFCGPSAKARHAR